MIINVACVDTSAVDLEICLGYCVEYTSLIAIDGSRCSISQENERLV